MSRSWASPLTFVFVRSIGLRIDIDAERAAKVSDTFGIPTVVADYDALLGLDLDIVDICTPSALHFSQARKALLAGRGRDLNGGQLVSVPVPVVPQHRRQTGRPTRLQPPVVDDGIGVGGDGCRDRTPSLRGTAPCARSKTG